LTLDPSHDQAEPDIVLVVLQRGGSFQAWLTR
jgi:hypothetical protein